MCKIKTVRKYQNYKIKITYNNGDIEDINFKSADSSSYKEMLEVYKGIKEDHKNDSCIIDFLGENNEKEVGVLFTKELNIKQPSDELDTDAIDIGERIEKLLLLLIDKKEYHSPIATVEGKNQDLLLHKIQHIVKNNITISLEEQSKMLNDLGNIRIKRELHKTQSSHSNIYFQSLDIKDILSKIRRVNYIIKGGNRSEDFDFSEEKLEQYNIITSQQYRTEKERIHLMSHWKPKYDRVVVNEAEKTITAFNYGYTSNKNKKVV